MQRIIVFDEWEFESLPIGARDVKIAANHQPTCAENILTDPLPLSQFLHLLPTPLWIMGLLSAFPDRFCLFQSGLDLLDNWPILWITEPSTGPHSYIAVSPFCGLGVPNENKRFVRAMVVLTPWHWQVTCTSTFSPVHYYEHSLVLKQNCAGKFNSLFMRYVCVLFEAGDTRKWVEPIFRCSFYLLALQYTASSGAPGLVLLVPPVTRCAEPPSVGPVKGVGGQMGKGPLRICTLHTLAHTRHTQFAPLDTLLGTQCTSISSAYNYFPRSKR